MTVTIDPLQSINCVSEMMNFAFQMMTFVLTMMDLNGIVKGRHPFGPARALSDTHSPAECHAGCDCRPRVQVSFTSNDGFSN